jgi:hypothetical protein
MLKNLAKNPDYFGFLIIAPNCQKILKIRTNPVLHYLISDSKMASNLSIDCFRQGFCSNMDLSDHAHILRTGVFEGEEFNKKKEASSYGN